MVVSATSSDLIIELVENVSNVSILGESENKPLSDVD
jgi:hypothetical protein